MDCCVCEISRGRSIGNVSFLILQTCNYWLTLAFASGIFKCLYPVPHLKPRTIPQSDASCPCKTLLGLHSLNVSYLPPPQSLKPRMSPCPWTIFPRPVLDHTVLSKIPHPPEMYSCS